MQTEILSLSKPPFMPPHTAALRGGHVVQAPKWVIAQCGCVLPTGADQTALRIGDIAGVADRGEIAAGIIGAGRMVGEDLIEPVGRIVIIERIGRRAVLQAALQLAALQDSSI